ncbi:MAG: T9SS type A sorting domain-containing protein [Bacteroidetes bacterium]|nr:T9SS type A sorting domain-containing protein [Bacteroidota bacterium]
MDWPDTPNTTASLSVTFSGCASSSDNKNTGSWSALILSVKDQAWSSTNGPANIDYCNTKTVNITVPHMWVQGTGGIAQPPLQEVVYSWTLPPGWYADGNSTITYINGITIHPTACAVPGIVQVQGVINYTCGSAEPSATMNISLSGSSPTVTIAVPQGYPGSTACNTNPVTFTALLSPSLGCVASYDWSAHPAGWTLKSQSGNTATFTPIGNSTDSDPNSPFKVKVNFTCGTSVTSGSYNPPWTPPVIIGSDFICNTGQSFSIANAPGQTVAWSSSSSGLLINSTTGVITIVNNYKGQATISATFNGCPVSIPSKSVYVGLPGAPGSLNKNINSPPFCSGTEKNVSINPVAGAFDYNWTSSNESILRVDGSYTSATLDAGYPGTCTFTVTASNACGASTKNYFAVVSDCSGGGEALVVYPNPATSTLTVQLSDSLYSATQSTYLEQPYSLQLFDRFSRKIYSIQSKQRLLLIPVDTLPPDIYYLNVFYNDAVLQKQLVINR